MKIFSIQYDFGYFTWKLKILKIWQRGSQTADTLNDGNSIPQLLIFGAIERWKKIITKYVWNKPVNIFEIAYIHEIKKTLKV